MMSKVSSNPATARPNLALPRIVFGTSSLGNLYAVVPDEEKQRLMAEIFAAAPRPVVLDSAGKYGAGLALATLGRSLRALKVPPRDVIISNKLGWYRVPLRTPEPTYEPGVWAGIRHDAELRISYRGILECHEQGRELLGEGYEPQWVSVHDPDEYIGAAVDARDRVRRLEDVLGAYEALLELKAAGRVKAVGIGAKDWRVIRQIAGYVELDWAMVACSLTVYSHAPGVLHLIESLRSRGIRVINSAVFHGGFLTGGPWFDYRKADPARRPALFTWRDRFFRVCWQYGVSPAAACVQFGLLVPGIDAVALNSESPARVRENLALASAPISPAFWQALITERLIRHDFPLPV